MNNTKKKETLKNQFSSQLLERIQQRAVKGPRTYGFEYEFISSRPLNPDHMKSLYGFLPVCGFHPNNDTFLHSSGIYITFEPGGQIEYHSLPVLAGNDNEVQGFLEIIGQTNSKIFRELNIEYLGRGYIPGRGDAPLCLTSKRYQNLHTRMPKSGTRGREMMKGSASIHFHTGIQDIRQLARLFSTLIKMSAMDAFEMGPDRRDIWNHTDNARCGLPYNVRESNGPQEVVEDLVRVGLEAHDIGENVPFYETKDLSFDAFMYHMTTIFTDVRLNMKGPSIELRSLDSVPLDEFMPLWKRFVEIVEEV